MNTYIVFVGGNEIGYIKAANHNSAEKKAVKKYPPTEERIQHCINVNPWMSREEAIRSLSSRISVSILNYESR